jgi:protein TonB
VFYGRHYGDQVMRTKVYFLAAMATLLAIGPTGASGLAGVMGGVGQTADATNNAAPGSKERPIRVSSAVIAGLILHKVDPVYPEDARDVSGAVVMAATIDDQGKIVKLSAISGPEKLRDAALTAVNQWTYKPYLLNGKAVFVQTMITVNFTLTQ